MRIDFTTTIVAPATGLGGALSIIRISGKNSIQICDHIFKSNSKKTLLDSDGFTILYGDILDKNDIIDDVLISIFKGPNSYTGENCIEISCHASPFIQSKILELLVSKGATPALPGEFTQRAYFNGKMDLSQAEAVADIISSETEASHRLALNQMRGKYSDEIKALREKMLHFASMIELELDFGEEEVEFASRSDLKTMVYEIKGYTDSLAASFRYGNVIKNGVPVAIIGKPNVGKSTLLNALLKDDKAIVSNTPGTTRDAIEDTMNIDGTLFRFIDTAGLRDTDDEIEKLGIERTYKKIEQAEIIILMVEAHDDFREIRNSFDSINNQIHSDMQQLILAINKCDLSKNIEIDSVISYTGIAKNNCFAISAKSLSGIDKLSVRLVESLNAYAPKSNLIVTNLRHKTAFERCSESLQRVIDSLNIHLPEDLIAMDLRQAIHYLGEITGTISSDEILGNIFKNFCLGK